MNLSLKPALTSAVVCSMPRSTQSPLEDSGWLCSGEMLLETRGASGDVPHQPMGRVMPGSV